MMSRKLRGIGLSGVLLATGFLAAAAVSAEAAEGIPAVHATPHLAPASVVPVAGSSVMTVAHRGFGAVRSYGAYGGGRGLSYSFRISSPPRYGYGLSYGSHYGYGYGYGLSSYRYSPRSVGYRYYGTGISAYYNRPYYYGGLYSPYAYSPYYDSSLYAPNTYNYYSPRYYGYSSFSPQYWGYSTISPSVSINYGYAPYQSYSVYSGGVYTPRYYGGYINVMPSYFSGYGYGCAPY